MKKQLPRIFIIAVIALLVYLFFALNLNELFTLDYLKSRKEVFENFYTDNQLLTIAVYMGMYILVTALSLPGAAVMSLAGGALFGLLIGTITISFASSIGATFAFLFSRFLLKDYIQNKFGDRLKAINEGIKKDGALYLFTLRLVPIFPFFVINLVMGLTPISAIRFYLVSQIGMLAGTIVYVNAGTQLAKIESLKNIMSPGLLLSFILLGIFPLIAKNFVEIIQALKIYAKYPKPKTFDYNLVVIGAGSAGLVASLIGAAVRAKVALVEKDKMGGDCLNTGCVPSKALIRSAKMLSYAKRSKEFGFKSGTIEFDFSEIMERVSGVIKKIEPHDSVERYTELGVDCIAGNATVTSPFTIDVNGNEITTRNIVLATGARPFVPPIKGLDTVDYLTSDNVWSIRKLPEKLIVLGGGPIGCEMTQAFARFGSRVTQVEMSDRIMIREDKDISEYITKTFTSEGVHVLTSHIAKEVVSQNGKKFLLCEHNKKDIRIEFDEILVAVGRVANTAGFGLEELGVRLTDRGTIDTDDFLRTNFPNIFCAGDVAGPYQFTHTASHQAWYASVNALFGKFKKFKADYRVIPWATFTDPEVARVGINEQEAEASNIDCEVTLYPLSDLDRAIADSQDHGFVKIITQKNKDKILGVTIVGSHASDLIAEYIFAMKNNLGLNKILGTIHIYPSLAEANKLAAGVWRKQHAPEKLLNFVEKFHAWMRR
ncbi:MAG: dihydrolipoyl dehydrogenase [Deltaproteobacteria bacterium]|nr:dihydrolipoyl dehydrogenase [Deltaproteobacteria bacterium]